MKERFEMTDIAKAKNRVMFNEAQEEDETTGMIWFPLIIFIIKLS